jgi:plasmid stabilization system protein ParE
MTDHDQLTDETPPSDAELTRLADGSLPEPDRAELRARVEGSPELRAQLRDQERAVKLVSATGEIAAPASLRASVEELADGATRGRSRRDRAADRRRVAVWRPRVSIALVAFAAVVVAIVSIALHGESAPTVNGTARLALAAAVDPAPATDPADRDLLSLRVNRIPFPSYLRSTGWRASGARRDTLDGRHVTTVFYTSGGGRVGYSIVSGTALAVPRGSTVRGPTGVQYVLTSSDGAQLITWRRDGHTCVIASRSVGRGALLALAAADEQV